MSTGVRENLTQVMDKPSYPNSNASSSSSTTTRMSRGIHSERKNSSSYRRERARELQRLSLQDLIDLVLRGEHKNEKTEARLKNYVLKCKEQADTEKHALEQMKSYQQKMTQIVLDAQQESVRARHDVEQYKLKLENAEHEIQRGQEVVKHLEEGKEHTERALTRARDKAREYREQTAVQLAREQGRRLGFEQGFEQGRLVFQLARARASKNQIDAGMRRALTQGPDAGRHGGERRHHSLGQRNPSDRTRDSTSAVSNPRPSTQKLSDAPPPAQQNNATSRSSRPPEQLPRALLQQSPSDGSVEASPSRRVIAAPPEISARAKSEGSQLRTVASSSRPPRHSSQPAHGSQPAGQVERSKASGNKRPSNPLQDSTYMPIPAPGPAPPSTPSQRLPALPVPPTQQFPAGVPPDNVSEASTSPASTVTGIDIVTFRDSATPEESPIRTSKNTRDQNRGPPAELPVIPRNVSSSANGGHPVDPAPSTSRSGWITRPPVEPVHPAPVMPNGLLNPASPAGNWSIPHSNRSSISWEFSLVPPSRPSSPPQPEGATEEDGQYLSPNSGPIRLPRVQPSSPDPRESPVLPVLPRIVPQATSYGTPILDSTSAVIPAVIYEEAPTPPGFHYPVPLGAPAGRGVAFADDSPRHSSYSPGQSPAGGFYAGIPASGSYATQSDSSSQPVIPSVVPGIYQGSPLAGNDSYNDPDEDTSFDSATKRNTQLNSQNYDSWQ